MLVRSCELGEPRQSSVFFEPSLRANDRGEGGEAAAGSRQGRARNFAIRPPRSDRPTMDSKIPRTAPGRTLWGMLAANRALEDERERRTRSARFFMKPSSSAAGWVAARWNRPMPTWSSAGRRPGTSATPRPAASTSYRTTIRSSK
jgi:hypothetical protein